MIRFSCPHCHYNMKASDEAAGKTGACGQCQQVFTVPARSEAPPPAEAAAPPGTRPPRISGLSAAVWGLAFVLIAVLLVVAVVSTLAASGPVNAIAQIRDLAFVVTLIVGVYALARAVEKLGR